MNKDKQQLIKEIESLRIPEGLGMGGPTPAQAYNFALDKVIEIIKRFNPQKMNKDKTKGGEDKKI